MSGDTQILLTTLTLITTVIGWFVVGSNQKEILRETRRYQKKERDLKVYRMRMEKACEITKELIMSSATWYKLASLARASLDESRLDVFFNKSMDIMPEIAKSSTELAIVLYDPEFRTLRDLLPEEHAKVIYDALKSSAKTTQDFYTANYNLDPSAKDVVERVEDIYKDAEGIGHELVKVANKFADAFAHLDKLLSQNNGGHNKTTS